MKAKNGIRVQDRLHKLKRQKGAYLVELVIVVLIIMILASISTAAYLNFRQKSYDATAQTEAVAFMKTQGVHYSEHEEYADDIDQLLVIDKNLTDSPGVTFNWIVAEKDEYVINVKHKNGSRWFTASNEY